MERFLQSLSPRLRGEVEATLSDVENRQRLEMVASRYIDEDGSWPTNTMTAESLAREYLNLISVRASFHRGAGLAPATAAALAGGVLTIAAGEGAVVLGSRLMNTYWRDMVAYSTGLNPYMVRTLTNVVRTVSQGTPWEEMVRTWTKDRTRSPASLFLGDNFPRLLERELFGVFRAVALRGARSAAQHVGVPVDEFATNEWVSSNVARFAQAQWSISDRSLRYILNVMETDDLSPRVTGERIRQTWYLSPRHTRAVENYRSGLSQQDRTARSVNQMVRSYAQRLANTRSQMIANTETARLFSAARENYWTQMVQQGQMPLGTKKMWVTAQDELVCRHCSPLDGEVAEFSQPFRNSDIGVHFPPVHPNCRCIIIPVEPDETVPDVSIMVYSPEQMVSKRTIIVPEYERADGTLVREHRRFVRGELPHAKTGFVSYLDAMKSDAEYRLSTPGWETMEKLGRKLRRLGYNWDNTHPNASRRRHIFTTTGSRSALFADNDRNIAARVGSHYHGSPASNPYIRGVQDAAKRIFGLDDASTAHFAPQTASSRDYIANAFGGLGYEPYVRAQMDVTQRHLAERGIEEVSVMRGMRMSRSDVEDLGISVVERRPRRRSRGSIWHTMTFQSQPLNSVTTSPIIASRYATGITGSLRDDDVAVIMRRRTPANEVFANYKTGLGMQRWQEWVTLGGRQEWEVIAIDPDLIATNIGPLRRAGITPGRRRQMTIEEIWNS